MKNLKYLLISPVITNSVIRVITKANETQLVINKNIVNNLPASLKGLTSWNPAVVIEIVVIYIASTNVYFSISMKPIIPTTMIA